MIETINSYNGDLKVLKISLSLIMGQQLSRTLSMMRRPGFTLAVRPLYDRSPIQMQQHNMQDETYGSGPCLIQFFVYLNGTRAFQGASLALKKALRLSVTSENGLIDTSSQRPPLIHPGSFALIRGVSYLRSSSMMQA